MIKVWQSTDNCINVCSELDWKRCVAVHLWYMLPPTASVADALAKYESAFQVPHITLVFLLLVFLKNCISFFDKIIQFDNEGKNFFNFKFCMN